MYYCSLLQFVLGIKIKSFEFVSTAQDETGVYKNLLQETAHRAGLNLPVYTTVRSGPGHVPIFSGMVELGRMSFTGEPARTKKQAQKNAAITAWSTLRKRTIPVFLIKGSTSLFFYPFPGESLPTIFENELVIHKDKESFHVVPLLAIKIF